MTERATAPSPETPPASPAALADLLGRRSVSPRRLAEPGPDADALAWIIQAALRGPDHGGLRPWRVVEFPRDTRPSLALAFEAERRVRQPVPTALDLARAREHALQPPVLLAFVVAPQADAGVPAHEQWLAAGAALGLLLQAAHQLGFGASILSGERCADPALARTLGLSPHESLAGFVSIGTTVRAPAAAPAVPPEAVWGRWPGHAAPAPLDGIPAAAVLVDPGSGVDAMLADLTERLRASGRRVQGLLAEPAPPAAPGEADACAQPMVLVDIDTGERYTVSQNLGPQARGCRADPRGFASASAVLRRALAQRPDLIVTNRFGGLESEGGGFSGELLTILSEGVPVLTAVSPRHLADWARFTGGATVLPPRLDAVWAWVDQAMAATAAECQG